MKIFKVHPHFLSFSYMMITSNNTREDYIGYRINDIRQSQYLDNINIIFPPKNNKI